MSWRAGLPEGNRAAGLEPQPVRALGKTPGIESDHLAAAVARGEVERVRKVQTLPHLAQSRLDQIAVLDRDIRKPEQMLEGLGDRTGFESVQAPHDPLQLEHHGARHVQRRAPLHDAQSDFPLLCRLRVTLVLDVEARQDVGVQRDHFRAFLARTRETSMSSMDTGAPLYLSIPKPSSTRTGAPVRTGTIRAVSPSTTKLIGTPGTIPSALRTFLGITTCPLVETIVVIGPSLCPNSACDVIIEQTSYQVKPPDDRREESASCLGLLRLRGRKWEGVRVE